MNNLIVAMSREKIEVVFQMPCAKMVKKQ